MLQAYLTLWLIRHRQGDQLIYRRAPWQEPPAPCALPILFEDEHLVRQLFCDCTCNLASTHSLGVLAGYSRQQHAEWSYVNAASS
jgi:hypothetical protein